MQHKFKVGDRVKPAGKPGPLMMVSCPVANTTLFERYFATPRYLCLWEGCDYHDSKRIFTEAELEYAAQPAGARNRNMTDAEPLFV